MARPSRRSLHDPFHHGNHSSLLGRWSYKDGSLTITEEGQHYPVDILELTRDSFRIRMHSPGEPVVIRFAPADQSPPETPTSATQGGNP